MTGVARWRRTNPLALAVLVLLFEGPNHPYELARTAKLRHQDEAMRLNFGSLYSVVNSLERHGLIDVVEVVRDGRRPERTIYGITESGVAEATEWLSDLLSLPVKEHLQFEAALALLGALAPDDVAALLEQRAEALRIEVATAAAMLAAMEHDTHVLRLFLLETEYQQALRRAELDFVNRLVAELRGGTFPDLDEWHRWSSRSISTTAPIPSTKGH